MKKIIGLTILFLFGWKAQHPTQFRFPKMLIVAAPHTSTWDILFTCASFWSLGIYPKFIIHKKWFKGVGGSLLKLIGGVSTQHENRGLVDFCTDLFNMSEENALIITPEGTKHKVKKWKTGFYQIALQANIPVCLGTLDYKNKTAGIGGFYNLSGNFEKDMNYIEKFYQSCSPKYADRYNKKIF